MKIKVKQLIMYIILALSVLTLGILILTLNNNKTIEISTNNTNTHSNPQSNTISNILIVELGKEEIPEIVTDEKATEKELKEEKVNKKEEKKSTSPYYIKVNYGANVVTIYKKDKDDNYTIPFKAMVCSCGTYTPKSGIYKTTNKYRWGKLIHNVYGQYATRIVGSILFHSVPYSSNTNDTLLFEQYDKLGTTASAGCIRLTVIDAKWIYDNCPSSTMVEFYSDSNPGPLGKPSAQKISSVEACRNWDPTDPATENPWHTYTEETTPNVPDTDIPSTEETTPNVPDTDTPPTEEQNPDVPNTDIPSTEEPTPAVPDTNIPSTEEPTPDVPDTDIPSTEEPNNPDTPDTNTSSKEETTPDTPDTNTPSTEEPTPDVPNTDIPSTEEQNPDTPNTDIPSTEEPNNPDTLDTDNDILHS